ncbi:hypothetical protein POM88_015516 [Heracleum sosnowskyi]|uniref:Uncharacterized protein n=1 Tax=Heracleum sosnowskyi TaxID=360622 RepID=A0AAD8ILK5_9APIA|nr:hypothetical protein POM88_015516 [Heracleum sosnowskyi]
MEVQLFVGSWNTNEIGPTRRRSWLNSEGQQSPDGMAKRMQKHIIKQEELIVASEGMAKQKHIVKQEEVIVASEEAVKNFNHEEYNNFFKSFNSEVAMRVRVSQKHKERNSLKNMLWSCLKEIKAKRREPIFQRSPAELKSWCSGGEDSLDRPVKEVRGSVFSESRGIWSHYNFGWEFTRLSKMNLCPFKRGRTVWINS